MTHRIDVRSIPNSRWYHATLASTLVTVAET
jgi:hypothetical protein